MNPLKKTTKGFSLVEMLISLAILVIMAGTLLLNNNNQKKSHEVQLATRTFATQLRLMQNDALNGKVIDGYNICEIRMDLNTNSNNNEYKIKYYDDIGIIRATETFELKKSQFDPETTAGGSISFSVPLGKISLLMPGTSKGIVLESKNSDQKMVVCVNEAGNIEEIKGDDQFCVGAGMCEPNCSGKTCGNDGCGGSCGSCILPQTCNALGTCCAPNCSGKTCGDDGCGGSCGSCDESQGLECSPINFVCAKLINDCQKLQYIGNGGYELTQDVDCSDTKNWNSGKGFAPIHLFSGKLEGNSKKISDLYMKSEQFNGSQLGLFGSTQASAEIKNVKLENVIISSNHGNLVGALVGENHGTISKASASGSIGADLMKSGGLVGWNVGTISDSDASVSVSGSSEMGGLVGTNTGTISNSSASGTVLATLQFAGGLAGSNVGTISDSHATGKVTGWVTAGGLVGQNINNGTIGNSEASGKVNGLRYVGGLVGANNNNCTINHSSASGEVSANQFGGGLVGTNVGIINDSNSIGKVDGLTSVGGFVGEDGSGATMSNSWWSILGSGRSNGCGLGICTGVTSRP